MCNSAFFYNRIMTDVRFDGEITELLKNLTGKTLESYSCDPFIFAPEVFGNDYCAPGGISFWNSLLLFLILSKNGKTATDMNLSVLERF